MNHKTKHSYSFSFFTAIWIAILAGVVVAVMELIWFQFEIESLVFSMLTVFIFSFFIIQIRVENLIYVKIKKLYKDISLLSQTPFVEEQVTTNMDALTKRVKRFARNKKLEIEALKIRENYRREFIGNVSHELKTPLFTVESYILTLLDGAADDKERRDKYLNIAHKGVERLIYIVNDLDMITKLESGELHLKKEKFDIVEVVRTVFELLEMKADEHKISLTFDRPYKKPIWVKADQERIQQVVTNLIINSIKYGKDKGTTEVSIENLTESKYIIRITDNGEGFRKTDIPRLFERFFRVDKSGSRKGGGSGLGLSIVKHILEAHNEKIYVESDFGIGSEFSFTLPKV